MTQRWILPKLTLYKFANMNLLWLSLARVWLRLPRPAVQAFHCTVVLGHGDGCKPRTSPGKQVLFLIHGKAPCQPASPGCDRFIDLLSLWCYHERQRAVQTSPNGKNIELLPLGSSWMFWRTAEFTRRLLCSGHWCHTVLLALSRPSCYGREESLFPFGPPVFPSCHP